MATEMKVCDNCRTINTCLELGCGQGRAAQPADVEAGELPELPEPDGSSSMPIDESKFTFTEVDAWSKPLVLQYARDAIAHQAAPAQPSAAEKEEILALHRQLAAEKLRADQGWQRAEAKSRECIELRERFAAAPTSDQQAGAVAYKHTDVAAAKSIFRATTPGPWEIDGPADAHVASEDYHTIRAGCGFYAEVSDQREPGFRIAGHLSEVDARLIAAAPNLLAALENIITNAVLQPDASMQGKADCYAVLLDDIDAARALLKGGAV